MLAAKLGVDAEETRRAYPRLAEVPFDSDYKFMATFHQLHGRRRRARRSQLVKGGPDVVLARCTQSGGPLSGSQVPIAEARADIDAANERMGEKGLRVLAFAARFVDDDELAAMASRPDVAHPGPRLRRDGRDHRPAAGRGRRPPSQTALGAGIDVRMITGDHAVTAQAIGETLGLGPGAISGAELQALSDEELTRRLPELHVFGRVSPRGQAAPRPADAGAGADRRDDRRRGQRRRRAQAGRHRRRDGQRQRGHEAGRPDDPHRRQLRHARARRRDRPHASTTRSSPTSATR